MIIFFIQTSGVFLFFFPSLLPVRTKWKCRLWTDWCSQSLQVVCLLSCRALLWAVGGFAPWGECQLPFPLVLLLLVRNLSNLCSWANFYEWCGILQKLLSARLFDVISTKFLLMENPWRLDSIFQRAPGVMGPGRPKGVLDSMKSRRLGPHLPNYYFQSKGELPFLSTIADKMETYSIFEAQSYSWLYFGASREDNDKLLWSWTLMEGTFL